MSVFAFGFTCAFLMLELMMPNVIYLNLALATFALGSTLLFTENIWINTGAFILALALSFTVIRPKVIRYEKHRIMTEHIKEKYLGKIAQVVEKIDKNSGILLVDDERWQARTKNDETIEQGQCAKITNYKDIIMYVEKI